ncbi:MAG: arginine--tRNA ligase [Nitrospinales bacterium]
MKKIIKEMIAEALQKAKASGDLKLSSMPEIVVEEPRDEAMGDFSTTVAMLLAKSEKQNPKAIAQAVCRQLGNGKGEVEAVEPAGPGFINLKMSKSFYCRGLQEAAAAGKDFGKSSIGRNQKINLEFVSANPTGPLHVGHGRGAAVGDTLARILRLAGYDVSAEYYINDVGNQMNILGHSTWLRYRELQGETVDFPDDHYQGEYIKEIAREIAQKHGDGFLEKPESERILFFKQYAKDWVLNGIKKDLAEFRVTYDRWFSEQSLYDDGLVGKAVDWLWDKGFIYEKDGAVWLRSSAFKDEKDRVIVKRDGEKTYFCSDIAYHKNKIDRGFEKIIDIWGADHHGYVARMQAVLEALGYDRDVFRVMLVQFVSLKRGAEKVSMSTRSGEFETLADVVSEVGVDAARFFFLMRSSDSHLDFDLELAKKETPENPVYYIQYAHARICSIFRTAQEKGVELARFSEADLSALTAKEDFALIKKILAFPDMVEKSALALEAHRPAFYLLDLAACFQSYYARHRVVTENRPLTLARLLVLDCLRGVIKTGLTLMGVSAPNSM